MIQVLAETQRCGILSPYRFPRTTELHDKALAPQARRAGIAGFRTLIALKRQPVSCEAVLLHIQWRQQYRDT
jgi:hypothetical protein